MPEETLSMIRALETDSCSNDECRRIADALVQTEQRLTRAFGERLSLLAAPRRLPNTLVLLAAEEILPWLSEFFGRIDFAQFTTTTLPFSVIAPRVTGHAEGDGAADAQLRLACALVHSELRHS